MGSWVRASEKERVESVSTALVAVYGLVHGVSRTMISNTPDASAAVLSRQVRWDRNYWDMIS